jgi:hypothetical protein
MNVQVYYATDATFADATMGPDFCQRHGIEVEHYLAATIQVDTNGDPETVAERAWSAMNRHDAPDQAPALDAQGLRSMCVGDVVKLQTAGAVLMVDRCGFKRIESFTIVPANVPSLQS